MGLLAVQGTLKKSLLQHHNSKASVLQYSVFFILQLSHIYMTTGKPIALTRWTFVGKIMFLLFKTLSRLVIVIRDLIYVIPEWSTGFPYFLQFNSELGNKEFMI